MARLSSQLSLGSTYGVLTHYPLTNEGVNDSRKINRDLQDLEALGAAHHARHENGGDDEISVGGLSGVLADPQPAAAHTHDGDTLQLDGVNSNGGAFAFNTTGAVTFNAAAQILRLGIGAAAHATDALTVVGNSTFSERVDIAADKILYVDHIAEKTGGHGTTFNHNISITDSGGISPLSVQSTGAATVVWGDINAPTIWGSLSWTATAVVVRGQAGAKLSLGANNNNDYVLIGLAGDVTCSSTLRALRAGFGALPDATAILYASSTDATTNPTAWLNNSSTGDAATRWSLAATISYIAGIDNSVAGDPWVLSTAASGTAVLGTGNLLTITSAGNGTLAGTLQAASLSLGRVATVTPIDAAVVGVGYLRTETYGSYSYWQMRRSSGAVIGTPVETSDGDTIGRLDSFGVTSGPAFSATPSTIILFAQDGASSATHVPGRIQFYTSTNAAIAERMRIDSAGNTTLNYASTDSDTTINWDSGVALFAQGSDGIVGIGTTTLPAWATATYPGVLHIGGRGALAGVTDMLHICSNAVWDVGDARWEINTGIAAPTLYTQDGSGGSHMFYVTNSGNTGTAISWVNALSMYAVGTNGLVINEGGTDYDSRIEGDSLTHLLFCDAGNDRIAIGHDTPDRLLHVAIDTATTNAEVLPLRLTATCSGAVVTGFAVGLEFEVEDAYADNYAWSVLRSNYTTAAGGDNTADIGVDLRCIQDGSAATYISCLPGAATYGDHVAIAKSLRLLTIRSGATQAAAGAGANELWKTASHATLPDNVLMVGV